MLFNYVAHLTIALAGLITVTGCGEKAEKESEAEPNTTFTVAALNVDREREPDGVLARYELDNPEPTQLTLPSGLEEISGLAMTGDGRLFGHNDELGVIYELDRLTGNVLKSFSVGEGFTLSEDLEGLAIVGETFYLVNSKGDLFEFREGAADESVEFVQHETELTGDFDVEGLCYDPVSNALLVACKELPGKELDEKKHRAVYSFSLETLKLDSIPRFILPSEEIEDYLDIKKFRPSGIERDPESGNFLIISGNDPAIIEMGPDGDVIDARALPDEIHSQPEGISIGIDGALLIANEGGWLVRYSRSDP